MARIRTFVAVDLPKAVRARVAGLQRELTDASDGVLWVTPASLHVTLLYLGDVDDRDLNNVCRAVGKACLGFERFALGLGGVGTFGPKDRPRTVWVGVEEGADELTALHHAIEEPLLAGGHYRREERKFSPHLTLGRVKGDEVGGLVAAIDEHTDWSGGSFDVGEVLVMASDLTRDGAVYSVMSRAKLG